MISPKSKLISLFSFLIFLNFSCTKEPDKFLDPSIDPEINLGTFSLLQSSIDKIPYNNKKGVVFVDSLNNEVSFKFTNFGRTLQEEKFYTSDPNIPKSVAIYKLTSYANNYVLENDSLMIHFYMKLYVVPDLTNPTQKMVADLFWIRGDFYNYSDYIDIRTSSFKKKNVINNFNINNRDFTDVSFNDSSDPFIKMYFNYDYGIVSFKDKKGKTWRFERFL
jgi:hypothetical protein